MRIEAEVDVIEMGDDELAPYTYDWTMRVQEAKAYQAELTQALSNSHSHTPSHRRDRMGSPGF